MDRYTCHHTVPYSQEPPAKMYRCECGGNANCPICGYGWGSSPCSCGNKISWETHDFLMEKGFVENDALWKALAEI